MKASPQMQARLLDLAALDTRLNQLDHALRSMPELVDTERMEREEAELDEALVRAQTEVSDAQREVAKADQAVQVVRDRVTRNQQRLDAGQGSAKDLQGMQHELETLARRQSVLEDEELEAMERAEAAETAERHASGTRESLSARLAEVRGARDEKSAQLDEERAEVAGGRQAVVDDLSEELAALYERLRERTGMGAALLSQRRCGGCRLDLNAVDLDRIRGAAPDEVLRCEECGRIMVRTEESGL